MDGKNGRNAVARIGHDEPNFKIGPDDRRIGHDEPMGLKPDDGRNKEKTPKPQDQPKKKDQSQ